MKFRFVLFCLLFLSVACSRHNNNALDDLDPTKITENQLKQMDAEYEEETGKSSHIPVEPGTCYQISCPVFALVDKETQKMNLYVNGELQATWDISSGKAGGHETPNFDKHPNGRIYDAYTSKKFPGGDFEGLGNMPYAVFIEGGYAIHGTSRGNWKRLGTKASHGCVRLHPDNAKVFNQLVRSVGIQNVWITIQ